MVAIILKKSKPIATMKNLSLITTLFFITLSTGYAQVTQAGNFMIGSTLGLSSAQSRITQINTAGEESEETPSSTQFSIAPSIGYFILDELAVGIGMDYTFSKVDNTSEDFTRDSDLLFGPFARYFFLTTDDSALFLEANFGFGNARDDKEIGGQTQKINTNIFALGFGPGFTVVSSGAVGIEALVKYNFAKSDFDTEIAGIKQQTISRTNQFDFSVGFRYYFGGLAKLNAN